MDWGNRTVRKALKEMTKIRIKLSEELPKYSLANDRKRQVPEGAGAGGSGGMQKKQLGEESPTRPDLLSASGFCLCLFFMRHVTAAE